MVAPPADPARRPLAQPVIDSHTDGFNGPFHVAENFTAAFVRSPVFVGEFDCHDSV